MEITPTGYVVLGMLELGPRSGYEIKQFADNSTRFFWAASYGQIYPELRRLEAAGLIAGEEASTGGRRRRVFRLEPSGRELLLAWLRTPPSVWELRDDALLKLFFADALPREEALDIVAHMREASRATVARFEAIRGLPHKRGSAFPQLVLQYGLDFNAWQIAWCDEAERRIRAGGSFLETLTPTPVPSAQEA